MMCSRIGSWPTGISGFGTRAEASRIRRPNPPQNSTTFIRITSFWSWLESVGRAIHLRSACVADSLRLLRPRLVDHAARIDGELEAAADTKREPKEPTETEGSTEADD